MPTIKRTLKSIADDPDALAGRALELLNNPALHRRMTDEAKRGAASRTPEGVGNRIIAVYEELIAERRERAEGKSDNGVGEGHASNQKGYRE